jgi:heat shock protein HtpX
LHQLLETLAEKAGLERLPKLLYLPTDNMAAFTMGANEGAIVVISDGLLRRLNMSEVAAVIAHEISHIRYGDTYILGFADRLSRFTNILSTFGQFLLILNLPMILLGVSSVSWFAIILLILAPSISVLLQLALSRTREYRADLGAAELLDDPMPLARALSKIAHYQNGVSRKSLWPVRAHATESLFLRTHPPTEERIRRLQNLDRMRSETNRTRYKNPYPANTLEDKPFKRYPILPNSWGYYGIHI